MRLAGKSIGFALCGSHCTLSRVFVEIEKLVAEGAEVIPILSYAVATTDTKFGQSSEWKEKLFQITGKVPLETIVDVEPIGPQKLLDILVVAPCTGNTMAKIANGIIDTPVTMATKAQLRNGRPVVLAISTNDGLGLNAKNLGILLNAKNIFWVPFGQDNPEHKPNSLDARLDLLLPTVEAALQGRQLQPILVTYHKG